jgi:peptidoglycan/LPS O-acetylase OafA/YrhL
MKGSNRPRYEELDVLRAVAAFSVLLFHLFALSPVAVPAGLSGFGSFWKSYGGMGVPLFYALSGISLYLGFFSERDSEGFVRRFFIRRFFRIYPLFIAALLVWLSIFVSRGAAIDSPKLLSSLTLSFNLLPGMHDSYVAAGWSIGVEMIFYLLFPVILAFVITLERAAFAFIASLLVAIVAHGYLSAKVSSDYAGMAFISHIHNFAGGILVFFIWQETRRGGSATKNAFIAILYFLVGAGALIAIKSSFLYQIPIFQSNSVQRALWSIPFLALVGLTFHVGAPLARFRAFVSLGQWSFGIYLIHPIALYIFTEFSKSIAGDARFYLYAVGSIILTVVAAAVSFKWLETPFMAMGRELSTRPKQVKNPTVKVNLGTERVLRLSIVGFVLVALLFNVYQSSKGWHVELDTHHGFRQAQTALTTEQIAKGGPVIAYHTPVFGPPWSIPMEFPVFQWTVARLHAFFHSDLISTGRAVSYLSFLAAVLAIYRLCRILKLSKQAGLFAAGTMLLTPLYVFWSRAFLIECSALALTLWFLVAAARAVPSKANAILVLAIMLGTIAGLTKVTTFLAGAPLLAVLGFVAFREQRIRAREWVRGALIVLIPLAISILWLLYSETIKVAQGTPMANVILSANLKNFTLGTVAQRCSIDFWIRIGHFMVNNFTVVGTTLVIGGLGLFFGTNRTVALGSLLTAAAGPAVFANLYFVHDYYWCANAAYLALFAAVGFQALCERNRMAGVVSVLVITCVGLFSFPAHEYTAYLNKPATQLARFGKALESMSRESDVAMVIGGDWSSEFAYYSKRRTIMPWVQSFVDAPGTQAAVQRISDSGDRLACLVGVGAARGSEQHLGVARKLYGFAEIPVYDDGYCAIYPRIARRPEEVNIGARVTAFSSGIPAQPTEAIDGKRWLFHAPATVSFEVEPKAAELSFELGLHPVAWNNDQIGDGVKISVTGTRQDGSIIPLAEYILVGGVRAPESVIREYRLLLPGGISSVRVSFDTQTLPSWDWSVLGNVRFR